MRTVSARRKAVVNLGNYESATVEIGVTLEIDDEKSLQEALTEALIELKSVIEAEVYSVDDINGVPRDPKRYTGV